MSDELKGRTIAVLATDGVEQVELTEPVKALKDAGAKVEVISNKHDNIQAFKHHDKGASTVTEWYKQNVYDPQNNKIGEIMDVLMDKEGKANALIIGVGGFLGAGEKDVAVPFNAVQMQTKDNKPYLVMKATKDELKNAKGFKYDRNAMNWNPEESTRTTGQGTTPNSNRR